jgi:uncharacterized protein (TIGR03435 family)
MMAMIRSWLRIPGIVVACALLALAAPAQTVTVFHPAGPLPSYDVATIKPPDPSKPYMGITVRQYIAVAYNSGTGSITTDGPPPPQTIGGPEWIDKDRYVITGKPPEELRQAMQSMNSEQRMAQYRMMEQSLLAERFHLKVHFETREMPVYDLVPAKGGLKIKPAEPDPASGSPSSGKGSLPPGGIALGTTPGGGGMINARTISMSMFVGALRALADELGRRPIVDKTGFAGNFDVDRLRWGGLTPANDASSQNAGLPSLTTALEEQLGMRLVPAKGQVEVVVIDSIDRPTEN